MLRVDWDKEALKAKERLQVLHQTCRIAYRAANFVILRLASGGHSTTPGLWPQMLIIWA